MFWEHFKVSREKMGLGESWGRARGLCWPPGGIKACFNVYTKRIICLWYTLNELLFFPDLCIVLVTSYPPITRHLPNAGCWASVVDRGPALNQRWVGVYYLLGYLSQGEPNMLKHESVRMERWGCRYLRWKFHSCHQCLSPYFTVALTDNSVKLKILSNWIGCNAGPCIVEKKYKQVWQKTRKQSWDF